MFLSMFARRMLCSMFLFMFRYCQGRFVYWVLFPAIMAEVTKTFPTSSVMPDSNPGLFKELADPALEHCKQTYSERSDQYGDSWRFDGWLALKASLFTRYGIKPTQYECIATALAALADVKYSRLLGGYNEDHLTDLIDYCAALKSAMREVYKEPSGRIGIAGIEYKQEGAGEPIQVRVNGEWKDL